MVASALAWLTARTATELVSCNAARVFFLEGMNTPLTIEDQGAVELAEDVGEVGIGWLPGRDLADSWARMREEGFIL